MNTKTLEMFEILYHHQVSMGESLDEFKSGCIPTHFGTRIVIQRVLCSSTRDNRVDTDLKFPYSVTVFSSVGFNFRAEAAVLAC